MNVQCSAQRMLTFRNLLTQIMIMLQNRLKELCKHSDSDAHGQRKAELKHISVLLEMMLEECREFRCVDLAHLIFRAWLRFHTKYRLEISSDAILILLDIAKRNKRLTQQKDESRAKTTRAFLETIATELENVPSTIELSIIPYCYLGNESKITDVKEKILQRNGGLTQKTFVSLSEGYGILNKPDDVLKLLQECVGYQDFSSKNVEDEEMSFPEVKARIITKMVESAVTTLALATGGIECNGFEKIPSDKSSQFNKLHRIAMYHVEFGYGILSKQALSSLASTYLFRANSKSYVSFGSAKFRRNISTSAIEKLLLSYTKPGKGFSEADDGQQRQLEKFDYSMLGMGGLCALIASNSFFTKHKADIMEEIMKEKVETLLAIILQRLDSGDSDSRRTSDMIESQHVIVCIRGLRSLNDKENILALFRKLQSVCPADRSIPDSVSVEELSLSGTVLNYDIYKEFIIALGRMGDIRDVLYIKAQLELDPIYGWESAHLRYNFRNGKEYNSSKDALVDIYGALLRIFRTSYPHHFLAVENEMKDRKLNLNSQCYCALLEFYMIERSDISVAASQPSPDGNRGLPKKVHELTEEIDLQASTASAVWSIPLLKILIKVHTFTPLQGSECSTSSLDYRKTKAYSYILLAKRLGYIYDTAIQRPIVRYFLIHGCKEELRKFLTEVRGTSEDIEHLSGDINPGKIESPSHILDLPNIDVCNSLIEYHGCDTFHKQALDKLLDQMEMKGIGLNEQTFLLLIEIYGRWGEEEKLENLLTRLNSATQSRDDPGETTERRPAKLDLSLGLPEKQKEVPNATQLSLSNDFLLSASFFSTLAQAYNALGKDDHEIEALWENLLSTNIVVNASAYNVFLNIFVNRLNFVQVERILATMMDKVPPNVLTLTTVIDLLGRMGKIEDMEKIFEEMLKSEKTSDQNAVIQSNNVSNVSCFPTSVTFHHLLGAYAKRGDIFKINSILEKMETHKISRTAVTYNILLTGYCRARQYNKVKEIIEERKKVIGEDIDIITSLVWIKSLGLCQLEEELSHVESLVTQKNWLHEKRIKVSFKFKLLYTLAVAFKNCHNSKKSIKYCESLLSDKYSGQVSFFYISSVLKIACALNEEDFVKQFVMKYIMENLPTKIGSQASSSNTESSGFESHTPSTKASISRAQVVSLANIALKHYCKTKQMDDVEMLLDGLVKGGVKLDKGQDSLQLASYVLELKSHKQGKKHAGFTVDISDELNSLFGS